MVDTDDTRRTTDNATGRQKLPIGELKNRKANLTFVDKKSYQFLQEGLPGHHLDQPYLQSTSEIPLMEIFCTLLLTYIT